MLPDSYHYLYQTFLQTLMSLKDSIESQQDTRKIFEKVKKTYTDHILPLNGNELEQNFLPHWRSIQTELHRTFRLLQTDLIFFGVARQNSEQRKQACIDRLETLMQYTKQLLHFRAQGKK